MSINLSAMLHKTLSEIVVDFSSIRENQANVARSIVGERTLRVLIELGLSVSLPKYKGLVFQKP